MYLDALTSQNCLAGLPGYPLLPRIPLPLSPLPFSHALLLSAAGAMDEVERTGRGGSPSRSRRWCPPARRVAPGGSEKLATTDRRRRELGGEAGPGREAPAAEISGGNRSGGSNAGIHAARAECHRIHHGLDRSSEIGLMKTASSLPAFELD